MIGRAHFAFLLLIPILICGQPAQAQNCTSADFGAVVDQTAQSLRNLNASSAKAYQTKVAALREKRGLSDAEIEARTTGLHDEKIAGFNREIESLVAQMDVLSQTPSSKITCEKLDELKSVRERLLVAMGLKSSHLLAKVEAELSGSGSEPRAPAAANPAPAPSEPTRIAAAPAASAAPKGDLLVTPAPAGKAAEPTAALANARPPSAAEAKPEAVAETKPRATESKPMAVASLEPKPSVVASAEPKPTAVTGVESKPSVVASVKPNTAAPGYPPPSVPERAPGAPARFARDTAAAERDLPPSAPLSDANRPTALAPPPYRDAAPSRGPAPLLEPEPVEDGYSMDEIREAGRGVFGTINAEFANAINYAFKQYGKPKAYITGVEGGGAFLAGLRYGKGTLYRRTAGATEIYWQGPSAGLDFGAEGGRALFLVYNLEDPYGIYGRFGGVGGSAYLAGGVGLTVLGKDGVIIVPIRSGLGLRLGANLAYVKFTERQTWNPF